MYIHDVQTTHSFLQPNYASKQEVEETGKPHVSLEAERSWPMQIELYVQCRVNRAGVRRVEFPLYGVTRGEIFRSKEIAANETWLGSWEVCKVHVALIPWLDDKRV